MKNLEKQCDDLWAKIVKILYPVCAYPGCFRRSVDAMHIIPRAQGKAVRWDVRNGRGGCREHHSKETKEMLRLIVGDGEYERLLKKSRKTVKYYRQDLLKIKKRLQSIYELNRRGVQEMGGGESGEG